MTPPSDRTCFTLVWCWMQAGRESKNYITGVRNGKQYTREGSQPRKADLQYVRLSNLTGMRSLFERTTAGVSGMSWIIDSDGALKRKRIVHFFFVSVWKLL